ncbi:hypothetical protein ACOHYD_13475 [Desulfobacterota bacterium M19]
MDLDVIKVGISVIVAVVGWIVGHHFNSRRDDVANRKKLITGYLVDAYRKLNSFACVLVSRAKGTESLAEDINSAVGDIQLFGTQRQIQLVKEISEHMVAKHEVPGEKLHDLLLDLRNSLRAELGLKPIDLPVAHLHLEYHERN